MGLFSASSISNDKLGLPESALTEGQQVIKESTWDWNQAELGQFPALTLTACDNLNSSQFTQIRWDKMMMTVTSWSYYGD